MRKSSTLYHALSILLAALCIEILVPQIMQQVVSTPTQTSSPNIPSPSFVSGRSSEATTNGTGTATTLGTQSYTGTGSCPTDEYCVYLPQPSLTSNLLTVFVAYSSTPSTTLTVATDQDESMTAGPVTTAESSKLGKAFYLCGATAGTRELMIASTSAISISHIFVGQYDGIATSGCLDTSSANEGSTNTTFTAGSLTPSTTGDLLVMDGCAAGTPARTSFTAGSQSNITWAKRGDDIVDGCMEQWGDYSSTSAINPQFTTSPTSTFLSTAMAFKYANAGTAPSGMYIAYSSGTGIATASDSFPFEFPSVGNLVVVSMHGSGDMVASVTDESRTWIVLPETYTQSSEADGETGGFAYAPDASIDSSGALTLVQDSGFESTDDLTFLDIVGASSSEPLTNRLVQGGEQTSAGNLTITSDYFPGTAGGLILENGGQQNNTVSTWTSPDCALFTASTYGGMSLNGPATPDENNARGICMNDSSSSQTWTMGFISSSTVATYWLNELYSFLPSGGSRSGPSFVQVVPGQTETATYLTIPITATLSGDSILISTADTESVSKICTGTSTTCSSGTAFSLASGSACSSDGRASEDGYLFDAPSGTTDVTVVFSANTANGEALVYEVSGLAGTLDAANELGGTGSTTSPYTLTGASVTTTGSPDIIISNFIVGTTVEGNPYNGNLFGYFPTYFSDTNDGANALIADSGTYASVVQDSASGDAFCNSTMAVK